MFEVGGYKSDLSVILRSFPSTPNEAFDRSPIELNRRRQIENDRRSRTGGYRLPQFPAEDIVGKRQNAPGELLNCCGRIRHAWLLYEENSPCRRNCKLVVQTEIC